MTIELTEGELNVVINWHLNAAKKIPAKMGKAMLQELTNHLLPRARILKMLKEDAEAALKHHSDRAQQLFDELQAHKNGWWNCMAHGRTDTPCTCGAVTEFIKEP